MVVTMTLFDLIGDSQFKHKYVLQRIVMHLTGRTRESLITHYDDTIEDLLFQDIERSYNLYAVNHEPLEYILWYVEYWWLRFHVNRATIIPRPETEYMIEAVREYLKELGMKNEQWKIHDSSSKIILVDVGTGSGVLWLSILHSHGSQINSAFLIDISDEALAVAKKNYEYCIEHHQINKSIDVVVSLWNLFDTSVIVSSKSPVEGVQYIILANLPYIPDETFDTNPDLSIKYEPRIAFVGGNDGLDFYRVMFEQIRESGCQTTMFLEMMTWQVDILRKEFDWLDFEEIKTFHFQIRIVRVMIKRVWA